MTSPTISSQARAVQDMLNKADDLLEITRTRAHHIGLAPFRIAHITRAIADNQHAWQELNELATALELTGEARPPCPAPAPTSTATPLQKANSPLDMAKS